MRRLRFDRHGRTGRGGRIALGLSAASLAIFLAATPALACGGLIGPNGAVNLLRTTTFAGYHDGVEHYVTAFQFAGGGGEFGSITPAARASRRASRRAATGRSSASSARRSPLLRLALAGGVGGRRGRGAVELMNVTIDALDITVLKGGAADIGAVGDGPRLPAPAGRARGPRLLRPAEPDLPRRGVRRRRGAGPRPAGRRRHAGPHHDPDEEPVGPAADPRPRQDRPASRSRPTSTS